MDQCSGHPRWPEHIEPAWPQARLHVDDEIFGLVRQALRETAATERRERDDRIAALRGEADRLLQRLDALYIDKLDGRVTDEFHDRVCHAGGVMSETAFFATWTA